MTPLLWWGGIEPRVALAVLFVAGYFVALVAADWLLSWCAWRLIGMRGNDGGRELGD